MGTLESASGFGRLDRSRRVSSSTLRMSNFDYQYPQKPPRENGVVTGTPVVQGSVPPRPPQGAPAGYPQNAGPYGAGPANYAYPPPTQQPVYYAPAQQPYGYPAQQTGPGADTCLTACLAALCCCCLMVRRLIQPSLIPAPRSPTQSPTQSRTHLTGHDVLGHDAFFPF